MQVLATIAALVTLPGAILATIELIERSKRR